MTASLDRLLAPAEHIRTEIFTDAGFDAVLFDRQQGGVIRLAGAAAAVWSMADGQTTIAQAIDELADIFGQPAAEIRADALDAVQLFDRTGLLIDSPPTAEPEHDHGPPRRDHHGETDYLARPPDP